MPGHGPVPKPTSERRTRAKPIRGEWAPTTGIGWQFDLPKCPEGLKPASQDAWATWFRAWFASHWTLDDLPGLRTLILTYDQVERGEFQRGPELRMLMDTYGITPKGQQDRRWAPPKADETPETPSAPKDGRYGHLKAV